MKFIMALVAFCGVFAWATAAPSPVYYPYGPQIYGGGSATAYGIVDATSDMFTNNIYGRYIPQYGYPSYGPIWA